MTLSAHFLGVGSASNKGLGCSACVIERGGTPLLLIDCGLDTLSRYLASYGEPPSAVFITHCHLDHIGGLEGLFHTICFDPARRGQVKVYVPVWIIPLLHQRLGTYPGALAEGGVNFWEVFHLIPVSDGFWHEQYFWSVRPARHHAPLSAFSIGVDGVFFYSGDTRPVPELISHCANRGETLFHDCGLEGNPSHSGVDDLLREYSPEQRARMWCYHYANAEQGASIEQHGLRVLQPGQRIPL